MKRILLVAIMGILSCSVIFCSESEKKTSVAGLYWKAERLVEYFSMGNLREEQSWETKLIYRLYQNPQGIIRQELTFSPPMSVAGIGRDVHLSNYTDGTLLVYDKGKKAAVRNRLDAVKRNPFQPQSVSLGTIKLLGFDCKGIENKVHNVNYTEVRQTWVATEISFKEPLLEVSKILSPDRQPSIVIISVVTDLKTADQLDPSLFKLPDGYSIIDTDAPKPKSHR